MRIAYLTSLYPAVSHTFVLREVQALRARGFDVLTFSVRRPATQDVLGADAMNEHAHTRWLVPSRASCYAWAFLWSFGTHPRLTAQALLWALSGRGMTLVQRLKGVCHFAEAMLLAHWLIGEEVRHLHCHFGNSGSSTGMLAARIAGIPFSITCHGSELRDIAGYRLVEKVAQAAFVVCVSKHGRAQLLLACPPRDWEKVHVVRCGPAPYSATAPAPAPQEGGILCVGRLSPEKGHLILLEALALLRRQGLDSKCTLVGDGPLRPAIEARIGELGLTGITLTGSLEPEQVAALYRSAAVTVLASFSEGVPVVLMEAMACGRPVIATRVGGIPELIEDGCSGLLVDPGDPEALAAALRTVLTDVELATRLGRNGARRVAEGFALDISADRLTELFRAVRGAGAASTAAAPPALALS